MIERIKLIVVLFLGFVLAFIVGELLEAEEYIVTKVPAAEGTNCLGGYVTNVPGGINNLGEVSGTSQYCPSIFTMRDAPYYFHNNTMLLLRYLPGDPYGQAYGINDAGLVVGRYGGRPFFFNGLTADFTLFGFLGDFQDVNNNGIAVGFNNYSQCYFGNCPAIGAIYRLPNGTIHEIPDLPNCDVGIATSINEDNMVVGYQINSEGEKKGFIYDIDQQQILEIDPALSMVPTDINNLNHVAGYFPEGGSFYWDGAGFQVVPMTRAYALSDGNLVVGELEGRAMIWHPTTGGRDLNNLVEGQEYALAYAKDINEVSQILVQNTAREALILTEK